MILMRLLTLNRAHPAQHPQFAKCLESEFDMMDIPVSDEDMAVSKSLLDLGIRQFRKFTRSIDRESGVRRLRKVEW